MNPKGKPPRLRLLLQWLREIFLMTQPPLLAVMQGGEQKAFSTIRSHVHRAPLQSLRDDFVFERFPSFLLRTDGWENDAPFSGRCRIGLDHLCIVLPAHVACGLWLRSF